MALSFRQAAADASLTDARLPTCLPVVCVQEDDGGWVGGGGRPGGGEEQQQQIVDLVVLLVYEAAG